MAMTLIHDTGLVFGRALGQTVRRPVWLAVTLVQPLCYLVLFGPLLEPLASAQGLPPTSAAAWFVPGLLVQLALFGTAFTGFGLISEVQAGVIDRLRVTPVSRAALLLGRAGRDVLGLVVQAVVLLALARLLVGFDPGAAGPAGVAALLALVALLGLGLAALSYTLALALGREDALASLLNGVSVPLLLLSGILLPVTLGPAWLQRLADLNPLHHTVEAARGLAAGAGTTGPVISGIAVTAGATIVLVALGVHRFRRLDR
jgi:ABC-2 type transport system permease protein